MKCPDCNEEHRLILLIPDSWWRQISPSGDEGGGELCARCIMKRLENLDSGTEWIAQPAAQGGADLVCLNILLDALKRMQDRLIQFRRSEASTGKGER